MSAKKLDGSEKAAVLLLTMGEDVAAQILAQLAPPEARRIAQSLARLGRVDGELAAAVAKEFQMLLQTDLRPSLVGNAELARRLLSQAARHHQLEDRASSWESIIGGPSPLQDTLERIAPRDLAAHLRKEHPQTIAVTLVHCHPKMAGEVLALLPASLHTETIIRMATLEAVDPAVLDEIDEALRAEHEKAASQRQKTIGGVDTVVALLARLDKAAADAYLSGLEERAPELATAVRERMLRFGDLARLSDPAWRLLLARIPSQILVLALRGAPEPVSAAILRNMSERAGKRLVEDLEALPKQRLTDVEAAQRDIVQLAKTLAAEGAISLDQQGEEFV